MPQTLSLRVHWHEKLPGEQGSRLVKTTPYLAITRGAGPMLCIQNGKVFGAQDGSTEVTALPEWFAEELDKQSPQALAEVGWKLPTIAAKRV